jgi:hypothetical protein
MENENDDGKAEEREISQKLATNRTRKTEIQALRVEGIAEVPTGLSLNDTSSYNDAIWSPYTIPSAFIPPPRRKDKNAPFVRGYQPPRVNASRAYSVEEHQTPRPYLYTGPPTPRTHYKTQTTVSEAILLHHDGGKTNLL